MIDVSSKLGADNVVDLSSKTSNNSFSHCEILARHIWLEFMIMKLTVVLLVFLATSVAVSLCLPSSK